jgi:hypothetical protein
MLAQHFAVLADPTRLTLLVRIRAAAPIRVSDLAVATGFQDVTVTERYNGSAWTIVPSPDPGSLANLSDNSLATVTTVGAGNLFAVGARVGLLHTSLCRGLVHWLSCRG